MWRRGDELIYSGSSSVLDSGERDTDQTFQIIYGFYRLTWCGLDKVDLIKDFTVDSR